MSPSKPARKIKVHVPRHNSQRIGPAVTGQVEALARRQRKRIDVRQTALDSSSALAQAIESASEWNSLLMTARADRGPQWDVGTQQFLVDKESELYYDPTPLLAHQKEGRSNTDENEQNDRAQMPPPDFLSGPDTPQTRRNPHMQTPMQNHMPFSPRHPTQIGMSPYGNIPPVPPAQFYANHANGAGDHGVPSPIRMSGMGMPMDGMSGMGMGMNSPDVRRRMTRGMGMSMTEDGFGGIH